MSNLTASELGTPADPRPPPPPPSVVGVLPWTSKVNPSARLPLISGILKVKLVEKSVFTGRACVRNAPPVWLFTLSVRRRMLSAAVAGLPSGPGRITAVPLRVRPVSVVVGEVAVTAIGVLYGPLPGGVAGLVARTW